MPNLCSHLNLNGFNRGVFGETYGLRSVFMSSGTCSIGTSILLIKKNPFFVCLPSPAAPNPFLKPIGAYFANKGPRPLEGPYFANRNNDMNNITGRSHAILIHIGSVLQICRKLGIDKGITPILGAC